MAHQDASNKSEQSVPSHNENLTKLETFIQEAKDLSDQIVDERMEIATCLATLATDQQMKKFELMQRVAEMTRAKEKVLDDALEQLKDAKEGGHHTAD